MSKASSYVGRYIVFLILSLAGCYYLYDLSLSSNQKPECMILIAAILGFIPLAFGFNILGSNGVKKAYAKSAGEVDIKFSVALVTDVEDQQVFRPIKFIYCKKGFLFDNGVGMLLRVRYEKVRDWSYRNDIFSIQVKDKWVLREYDLKCQNEMQIRAIVKYMNRYVPKEEEVVLKEPDVAEEPVVKEPVEQAIVTERPEIDLFEEFDKILDEDLRVVLSGR